MGRDNNSSGWTWFDPPAAPVGEDDHLALARATVRVFASDDGQRLLAHLTSLTVDRCLGADATDAALRMLEGQRQLVHHLLSLLQLGRHGRD